MRRVRLRVQVVGAARLSSWRARAGTARLAIPTSSSLLRRGAGWRPEFRTFRRSPSGGSPASGSGVSTLPRSSAAPPSPYVDLLRALQAAVARHRLLTAVTIVAEAGDLHRFRSASAFMASVGLVPSEHSSGGPRRRGHVIKIVRRLLRQVLGETAHYARPQPAVSEALRHRQQGVAPKRLRSAGGASSGSIISTAPRRTDRTAAGDQCHR